MFFAGASLQLPEVIHGLLRFDGGLRFDCCWNTTKVDSIFFCGVGVFTSLRNPWGGRSRLFPGNGTFTDTHAHSRGTSGALVMAAEAIFPGKPSNSSPRASEHPRRVAADQHRNFLPSLPESGRVLLFLDSVHTHTPTIRPGGSSWFPDTHAHRARAHTLFPRSPSTNTHTQGRSFSYVIVVIHSRDMLQRAAA